MSIGLELFPITTHEPTGISQVDLQGRVDAATLIDNAPQLNTFARSSGALAVHGVPRDPEKKITYYDLSWGAHSVDNVAFTGPEYIAFGANMGMVLRNIGHDGVQEDPRPMKGLPFTDFYSTKYRPESADRNNPDIWEEGKETAFFHIDRTFAHRTPNMTVVLGDLPNSAPTRLFPLGLISDHLNEYGYGEVLDEIQVHCGEKPARDFDCQPFPEKTFPLINKRGGVMLTQSSNLELTSQSVERKVLEEIQKVIFGMYPDVTKPPTPIEYSHEWDDGDPTLTSMLVIDHKDPLFAHSTDASVLDSRPRALRVIMVDNDTPSSALHEADTQSSFGRQSDFLLTGPAIDSHREEPTSNGTPPCTVGHGDNPYTTANELFYAAHRNMQ